MNDPSDNARRLPELAKTLHTERHRELRELLVEKRKAAGADANRAVDQARQAALLRRQIHELGERRLDVLEYLDVAAAIGFDPREPLGALPKE